MFDAATGTLRFDQALNADWRWSAQLGTQRLKTDDLTAFPFGCTDAERRRLLPDRFCPDGTFDFYDFRSENEKRRQDAAALNLKGKLATGAVAHDLSLGLLTQPRAQPVRAAGLQLRRHRQRARHGRRAARDPSR